MATSTAGDKIRLAARDLFYRQGIRAVGVDEIVAHAGVTKPSLYRYFSSKDDLVADYVAAWGERMLERLEATLAQHPDDPRGGLLAWMKDLADRATSPGFRGCGVSNAVVEFPQVDHQGRAAALANKEALRKRLRELARAMDARKPKVLGDSLLLLIEGAYATGQLFDEDGPAGVVAKAATALIDAHMKSED